MVKKTISLFLIIGLLLGTGIPARAETLYGDSGWQVTFTGDSKMESNFRTSALNDAVYGMQPGDTVILSLDLSNQNSSAGESAPRLFILGRKNEIAVDFPPGLW